MMKQLLTQIRDHLAASLGKMAEMLEVRRDQL
jgi:hypothetical protein